MFNICDINGNGFECNKDIFENHFDGVMGGHYNISIDNVVMKEGAEFGCIETTMFYTLLELTPSISLSTSIKPSIFPTSSTNPSSSTMPSNFLSAMPTMHYTISRILIKVSRDFFPQDTN